MGHTTYLTLELIWALPIVVIQFLVGADQILRRWKVWLLGILIPSIYLTFADSFAIVGHTWTINPDLSLGVFLPFGVPIEELIFFLLTNAMIVQGLILVAAPGMRARLGRMLGVLRRGPDALPTDSDLPEAPTA